MCEMTLSKAHSMTVCPFVTFRSFLSAQSSLLPPTMCVIGNRNLHPGTNALAFRYALKPSTQLAHLLNRAGVHLLRTLSIMNSSSLVRTPDKCQRCEHNAFLSLPNASFIRARRLIRSKAERVCINRERFHRSHTRYTSVIKT